MSDSPETTDQQPIDTARPIATADAADGNVKASPELIRSLLTHENAVVRAYAVEQASHLEGDEWSAALSALVADPESPDTLFAGMTDGSVWMSADAGDSFHQILTGLPSVHSLAVAPS